ncbi:MAG: response regulator [Nitrospinae bacterium]|nr:response regulator [Nitrospinota bacterium]
MLKVLIADDDSLTLAVMNAFFVQKNFTVKSASDGSEAIQILATDSYDLVISDVNMTPMDGITLLKTLRDGGNNIPFIIITGHPNMDDYIGTVQKLGAFEYIQKPVELDALYMMIKRLTGRNDI